MEAFSGPQPGIQSQGLLFLEMMLEKSLFCSGEIRLFLTQLPRINKGNLAVFNSRFEYRTVKPLIEVRKDKFDSELVESGPPPVKLSDGNYFFIYNSARKGFPSPRPDW